MTQGNTSQIKVALMPRKFYPFLIAPIASVEAKTAVLDLDRPMIVWSDNDALHHQRIVNKLIARLKGC